MAEFHLRPFTPDFCQVFNILEIDFSSLFQNLACAVKIGFCLARNAAFFIEFGKVDI